MEDEEEKGGSYRRKARSFFKVFLPGLNSEKLRVPPAFWAQSMVHKSAGSSCSLVGPSGNTWPVELVKNEEELFLETGWKEFVHDHSLRTGEFLVFEYQGSLRFVVHIFDLTTCEKTDAFCVKPSQNMSTAAEGTEDWKDVSLGCFPRKNSEAILRGSSNSAQGTTRIRVSSKGCTADGLQAPLQHMGRKIQRRHSWWSQSRQVVVSQRRPITREEIERALREANSFESKNPFYVLAMRKTFVYSGYNVIIPRPFACYFPKATGRIKLCGPCGNSWPVTFLRVNGRCYLSAGWRKFSFDNQLEENDACVFEIIKTSEVWVHIFRVVKEITPLIRKKMS